MQDLALKVVEGIIGKKPINPFEKQSTVTSTQSNANSEKTYYRVVAGSFTDRKNAEKIVEELKKKGYSAFVDIYKK